MHRCVIVGVCIVNLFVKSVVVAGSFHVKLIVAELYLSKLTMVLQFQPILTFRVRDLFRAIIFFRQTGKLFLGRRS